MKSSKLGLLHSSDDGMRWLLIIMFIGWLPAGLLSAGNAIAQSSNAQSSNEKVIADIQSAYEKLDFPIAEARITTALSNYQRFTPEELSAIHIIYALILFTRNDLAAAELQLRQALQLTPSLTLDPTDTPPQLLSIFSGLQQEISDQITEEKPDEVRYLIVHDPRAAAAVRSMLVPGWGQLYKGEKQKGVLLASFWAVSAGGTIIAHINRQQARDHYLASETSAQTQERFKHYSNWHKVRNNLFIAAAGTWAFSYIDAILRGGPTNTSRLQFMMMPTPTSRQVAVRWRF